MFIDGLRAFHGRRDHRSTYHAVKAQNESSRHFLVSAGYRQFRYKRTDGEGDEAVDTTVSVIGPQVGFSFGIF